MTTETNIERDLLAEFAEIVERSDKSAQLYFCDVACASFLEGLTFSATEFYENSSSCVENLQTLSEHWYAFLQQYFVDASPSLFARAQSDEESVSRMAQREIGYLVRVAGCGVIGELKQRKPDIYRLLILHEPAWYFSVHEAFNEALFVTERWRAYCREIAKVYDRFGRSSDTVLDVKELFNCTKSPAFNLLECRWLVELEKSGSRKVRRTWSELLHSMIVERFELREDQVVPLTVEGKVVDPVFSSEMLEELLLHTACEYSETFYRALSTFLSENGQSHLSYILYQANGQLCFPTEFYDLQKRQLLKNQITTGATVEQQKHVRLLVKELYEEIEDCSYEENYALNLIGGKSELSKRWFSRDKREKALQSAFAVVLDARRKRAELVSELKEYARLFVRTGNTTGELSLSSFLIQDICAELRLDLTRYHSESAAEKLVTKLLHSTFEAVRAIPDSLFRPPADVFAKDEQGASMLPTAMELVPSSSGQKYVHGLADAVSRAVHDIVALYSRDLKTIEEKVLIEMVATELVLLVVLSSVENVFDGDDELLWLGFSSWLSTSLPRTIVKSDVRLRLPLLLRMPGVLAAQEQIGDPITHKTPEVTLYLLSLADAFAARATTSSREELVELFNAYVFYARSPYVDLYVRQQYSLFEYVNQCFTLSTSQALVFPARIRRVMLQAFVRQMDSLYHDSDEGHGWFRQELFFALRDSHHTLWLNLYAGMLELETNVLNSMKQEHVRMRGDDQIMSCSIEEREYVQRYASLAEGYLGLYAQCKMSEAARESENAVNE